MARAVDLISHHETGSIITNYEAQVEDAFAQCERLGIHHVKSGYVGMEPRVNRYDTNGQHLGAEYLDGQYMVRHYRKIAMLAAKYHIMLDAHEPHQRHRRTAHLAEFHVPRRRARPGV